MNNQNAFWREVVDYLPKFVLIFRVDDNEEAQLIFCNKRVSEELGYSPREYVLASEKEGTVQDELEQLVEEIARRSHDVEDIPPSPCKLTGKDGRKTHYDIDFRLFKTKTGQAQLIAVELSPHQNGGNKMVAKEYPDKKEVEVQHEDYLVYESSIMQSVWENVKRMFQEPDIHILFRGEWGTGKRTLAKRAVALYEDKSRLGEWNFSDDSDLPSVQEWNGMKDFSGQLVLLLVHIEEMGSSYQHKLLDLLKTRESGNLETRVIATCRESLEEQVENNGFQADLYYHIGFQTVLIPPLRYRKEDVRAAALKYIDIAGSALQLNIDWPSENEIKKLQEQEWPQNFPQLYKVLRRSMLESDENEFRIRLKEKQKFQLFPEQQITEDEVLGFDEMNRRYLERVLELTSGKIYGDDGAAALLDLKPTTLQSKLKRLGIK